MPLLQEGADGQSGTLDIGSATLSATGSLSLLGSTDWTGASGELAVNPNGSLVFVSGTSGSIRVNATNPSSLTTASLPSGAGVAVDRTTGRYALANAGALVGRQDGEEDAMLRQEVEVVRQAVATAVAGRR